jgi:hypothetical protein
MNVEIGTEAAHLPIPGIHKWDFRCNVVEKLTFSVVSNYSDKCWRTLLIRQRKQNVI